ncbi:hypothetical protein J2I47_19165 [Fibrella sp. HMF5335]|uniref:Uncharacterized protein n=1 Tax=Fibrella rubiginis TaxID=2817060 RepID=A0A939K7J1_9BACT|nr:hypothetical protein [Fibrella rubiginis]MBO0938680.1 hypothetical protein [Fibrella rubiginis]
MNNRLLLLCLLLPLFTEAQTLKTVKKRSKYLLEQFEVLTDNDTMRAGNYKKMLIGNKQLLEEGRYETGRRVGPWTFYNQKGETELVYDYTTRQVVTLNRPQKLASLAQVQQGDTIASVYLDAAPVYLASTAQLYTIMGREVRFPVQLLRSGITELSYKVVATVSPMGTSYRVIASNPADEFKKSARDAMNMAFKGVEWVPVVYQDKPVPTVFLFESIVLTGFAIERPPVITTQMVGRPR